MAPAEGLGVAVGWDTGPAEESRAAAGRTRAGGSRLVPGRSGGTNGVETRKVQQVCLNILPRCEAWAESIPSTAPPYPHLLVASEQSPCSQGRSRTPEEGTGLAHGHCQLEASLELRGSDTSTFVAIKSPMSGLW